MSIFLLFYYYYAAHACLPVEWNSEEEGSLGRREEGRALWWGFLKFPCLKPKTTSLHAWLHKTKFRVRGLIHDSCGLNMSRHACLSTWMLTIWHKKTIRALVFHFFDFFEFLCPFESWSNPRFDPYLNKLKTWKWKGNLGSFLVTLKLSFWEVFEISMFENPKPLLFMLDFIRYS